MSNFHRRAHTLWIIFPFYDFEIRVRHILTFKLETRDSKDPKTFYRLRVGSFFIKTLKLYVVFWVIDSALNHLKTTILNFSSFFLNLAQKLDTLVKRKKGLKRETCYSRHHAHSTTGSMRKIFNLEIYTWCFKCSATYRPLNLRSTFSYVFVISSTLNGILYGIVSVTIYQEFFLLGKSKILLRLVERFKILGQKVIFCELKNLPKNG